MSGIIFLAACLAYLNRLFFRGQIVSSFVDAVRVVIPKMHRPTDTPSQPPASCSDPASLVVRKSYTTGPVRTETAKPKYAEYSEKEDAIFAPEVSEEPPVLKDWDDLCVRPTIGEDGEMEEPEAPATASLMLHTIPTSPTAELHDPAVVAALGEMDFGERLQIEDATPEELSSVANFDMRAYS